MFPVHVLHRRRGENSARSRSFYSVLARTLSRDHSRAISSKVKGGKVAGRTDVAAVEAVGIAGNACAINSFDSDSHRSHSAATAVSRTRVSDQPVTAAVTKWVESQHRFHRRAARLTPPE